MRRLVLYFLVPIFVLLQHSNLINAETRGRSIQLPQSCAEALKNETYSGIYQLYLPYSNIGPFYVYCLQDPAGGPAWTVIQRRKDGTTNFYRTWEEYKRGFGSLHGEFFIGLEQIHALTTRSQLQELWIQMEDFEGQKRFAKYDLFAISDESTKYTMNILGTYRGDAGDSLTYHKGFKFTTKDAKNDNSEENCAIQFTGAWWYDKCHESNLNGQYLGGAYDKKLFAKGVNWKTWRGYYYSLKYTHMAIRPVKY